METDAFRIEDDKTRHIATVRLTRPGSGNKLLAAEMPALGQAIRAAGSRKDVKLVLLFGAGRYFSAGFELADHLGDRAYMMLEGFRPKRVVRFYPATWKVIALPKEEEFFGRE